MDSRLTSKLVRANSLGPNVYEEVRFFSDEKIQKAIDKAVEKSQERSVILKVDVDGSGEVKAVLAARPFESWTIAAVFGYDFTDKSYSGGAEIAFEW